MNPVMNILQYTCSTTILLFPHLTSNKPTEASAGMIVEKSITVCPQMKRNSPGYYRKEIFVALKSQLNTKKNNLN